MEIKKQSGFTLIELIVVIVILGILAAVAVPRFVDLGAQARVASINGLAAGIRSGVAITQARYFSIGNNASTEVFLQGQTGAGNGVTVAAGTGLPAASATGIERTLTDFSGFAVTHGVGVSTFNLAPTAVANCLATYTAATGLVTVTITGC